MQNKTQKIDKVFFILIIFILVTGLLTTMFIPDDINAYENRYANKLSPLTAVDYADGSFQNSMENAFSDQVQFAQLAKECYNYAVSFSTVPLIGMLENATHDYVYSNGIAFYEGKVVYTQTGLEARRDHLTEKTENLNSVIASHPELDFYAYYIEKDTDINFTTGERLGADEYIFSLLDIPEDHRGIYEINSFAEFDKRFYDTDHHWNYIGSYAGYREVLSLISDDEPLEPTGIFHSGLRFTGSKAMSLGKFYTDEMSIYRFAYAPMTVIINGTQVDDYGQQNDLIRGELSYPSYGAVYGGDEGEIIFDTGKGGENILIIGESYDNAILKLLACHFSKTLSIDLRNYEVAYGEKFDFDAYVKQHGITKVLLIGNVDYYVSADFMI